MPKRKDKKGPAPTVRCSDCGGDFPSKYALKVHREICRGAGK